MNPIDQLRERVIVPPIQPRQRIAGVTLIAAEAVVTYDALAANWGISATVGVDLIALTVGSLTAWKLIKANPILLTVLTLGLLIELAVGFSKVLITVAAGPREGE